MEGMLNNDLDTRAGWLVVGGQSAVKQPRATSTALSLHRLIARGVSLSSPRDPPNQLSF